MIRAIVRKELRETWVFVFLATVAYLTLLNRLMGNWSRLLCWTFGWLPGIRGCAPSPAFDFPFIVTGFERVYGFIGCVLAVALGFRQSAWEPSHGTSHYLLHLPLRRNTIFLTKLFAGIGLLMACTFLPIVIYAGWTAYPGTHHAPFELSMLRPTLEVWLILPLAYLGAFASGIRPARWYGTRLLPLAAVLVPVIILQSVHSVPHAWLIGPPLLCLIAAAFIANILLEARIRDF
jgi:hypothetical protein